jgi:hypothetical protein
MATTVPSREAIYDVVRTLRDVMNKCLCLCQKVLISFSPGFSRVLAEQDKMVNRLTVGCGRQGRESNGVQVPCRQLPDSDG